VFCILFALFIAVHTFLVINQRPLLRLVWVKNRIENERPLYEKWNAFSRITVKDDKADIRLRTPKGWGLSPVYLSVDGQVKQMGMSIDATAGTVLTFDGNLSDVEHPKYDVTKWCITSGMTPSWIGAGGGRDVPACIRAEVRSAWRSTKTSPVP
jgi:hypothetical protein